MKITVVGIGYVGLSLAVLLSQHNEVTAVDVAAERIELVNRGISPFADREMEDFLGSKKLNLTATADSASACREADYVEKKRILPDGSVQYYGGGDILGYDFWKFISEYRLQALLFICIILVIAGLAIIWVSKKTAKTKS